MKRTDIEKIERELKKKDKKATLETKRLQERDEEKTEGYYITTLNGLFQYDENSIFNIPFSDKILEVVMEMQANFSEKEWENIFRKAIKKTKVKDKETALKQLMDLLS